MVPLVAHGGHNSTLVLSRGEGLAKALEASRKVASRVPADLHGDDWALYQTFLSMPLYTLVRFGRWQTDAWRRPVSST